MILSKICKLGQCDDGITHWDQNLSSWILEHAEESEEFRPFFALSSESDAPPVKDQFNPAEEVVSSTRANKDQWKPMRPESLSKPEQATSDFGAANDVITDGEEHITEYDSQAPKEEENDVDHLEAADEQALEDEPVLTYEEGLQVGIQQGVEQGRRDAERLAEEKVSQLRQKIDSVIQAMTESRQMALEELDDDLARLSMHIARQILRAELSLSPVAIQKLVAVSLENFSPDDAPRVCLNPSDLDMMREVQSPLFEKVTWVADENLSSGSVRVECGERRTEDLVEERLSAVANKLLKDVDAIFLKPVTSLDQVDDRDSADGYEAEKDD